MDTKNKKILVICESPAKSKHISKFLKDAGYKKAVVIASVGHISNLKDNKKSYKNTGVYPEDNFRLNIALADDKRDVINLLQENAKAAEYVYLMTDGDREGEAIAWSLVHFLKLKAGTYFRAITHEITPKAVIHAIENPVELNYNLIDAAHARMAIDKMVGYALSPIAKAYIGAKSVGRCQSAGLKLIVDRENEIQNFQPEIYYDLYLNFEKNKRKFKAKYIGTDAKKVQHLNSEADVNVVKFKCNSDYIVKSITKKEKQEVPKPPFCTATFQQEAANKLGLKVKDAMSIAQKLFENGFISYHRTDDQSFSSEFLAILKPFVETKYGNYTEPRKVKQQENAQNGHECLRIINPELTPEDFNRQSQNSLNAKVYELIWQRTIASVMPNAIISETTYNIYNNDQKFNLIGNELVDAGYRVVYNNTNSLKEIDESFDENEILNNCELESEKKQTMPPARFSEASLVKELQDRSIGRPSTFSTIVETVLSPTRGYATLEEKKIVPTERGIQLSNFLDRSFSSIINLNYTSDLESCLDEVSAGEATKLELLNTFYVGLEDAIAKNKETCPEANTDKKCPLCGSDMVIRRSRFGKLFYGCTSYPSCHGLLNIE